MKYCLLWVCIAGFLFTGCAAGKVYVNQSNDIHASCTVIEEELQMAQHKIEVLEETDHTLQNIRDVALSAVQLVFAPIGVLNAVLTLSDSAIADMAETKVLKDRRKGMVAISNRKNCGYKYAMIQRDAGNHSSKK